MKTLKISEDLHRKIKVFCAENNLKINEWADVQLKSILNVEENRKKENDNNERS